MQTTTQKGARGSCNLGGVTPATAGVTVLQGLKTWRPPVDAELNEHKEAVFASDAIVATDASASTDTASSDLAFIEPMEHTFDI